MSKHLALLVLVWLGFSLTARAQADCRLQFAAELPTDSCRDYRDYAPLEASHTPVKLIRIVVHVVQQDAGLPARNFENNSTGHDWVNAMLWQLNVIFRNLVPLSHPIADCPSTYMKDARIQFRTDSIFFHQDSRHWKHSSRGGATWCNIWDNLVGDNPDIPNDLKDNAFHVFLVHSTWSEWHTGFSPGIGILYQNFVVMGGYYIALFENEKPDLDNTPYGAALTLAHEFGHAFGLYHSNGGDYCCDTETGKTNNLMNSGAAALSECQLGRMHYLLESGEHATQKGQTSGIWEAIATDYCSKDESYDIEIPAGQTVVWTAPKKLTTDIVVRTGAQLIIRCRIGLPDDARIEVERGARLILDGGSITHNHTLWPRCASGIWGGITAKGGVRRIAEGKDLSAPPLPKPRQAGEIWVRNAGLEHVAGQDIVKK